MRGTHLLREGNVYIVACSDTTYPSMEYLGMSERGRYLHFHNTRNDTDVVFDQDHPHVIKSQWEIREFDNSRKV